MSKKRDINARIPEGMIPAAMEETLKLYHAWLGYLLAQQQTDTLRVKAGDIRRALDDFTCSVTREGEEYVIRLRTGKEGECDGCEEPHA